MADPKQIDRLMQSRLTKSIQKAASLALVSDKDRSQIIADQLTKDNIPKELTKVAAQAFNRRLAVRTIGVRPDENKADEFPIADIQKVASLRGIQPMEKVASVTQTAFSFNLQEAPQIRKEAYVKKEEKSVPLSLDMLQTKIQNLLDKKAAQFQNSRIQLMIDQQKLDEMRKQAAIALTREPKTVRLLKTKYAEAFDKIFPEFEHINKTAAYAVLPNTATINMVQQTMLNTVQLQKRKAAFTKTASDLNRLVEEATAIDKKIKQQILIKRADGYTVAKDIAANIGVDALGSVLGFIRGAGQQAASTLGSANSALFSKDYAKNPASAITAPLINTDRYDDARMALIRNLADPQFKSYKASQINDAVMDQIANNPHFQSPKYNKLLQVGVSNYLLNEGKDNLATLAAQSAALKAIVQGRQRQDEMSAASKIKGMKDQTTKDIAGLSLDNLKQKIKAAEILDKPYNTEADVKQWANQRKALQMAAIAAQDKLDNQRAKEMRQLAANRLKAQMHLALTRTQQRPTWSRKKYGNKPITSLNQLSKLDFQRMVSAGKADFQRLSPDQQQSLIDYVSVGGKSK